MTFDQARLAALCTLAMRLGLDQLPKVLSDRGEALGPEFVVFKALIAANRGQERTTLASDRAISDAPPMPLALPYADAGRLLGVSDRTVRRLVERGELRSIDVGGSKRIPLSEVEAFVARSLEAA